MAQASGGRVWWPSCGEADGENTDQPKSYAQLAIEQDAKVHASRERDAKRSTRWIISLSTALGSGRLGRL